MPRDDLVANVWRRAADLQRVHLLQQDGCEDVDDDLLTILDLRKSMVQVGGGDQDRALEIQASKLISRPEPRQIVIPDQQTGDHGVVAGINQNQNQNDEKLKQRQNKQTGA